MSNTLILNQSYVNVGLDTMTHTIAATGPYNVKFEVTEVPPSGLSVVVNDNGSPIFTAPTIGQTQSAQKFKFSFLATETHVITIVISSVAASDQPINNVKSIISIGEGF